MTLQLQEGKQDLKITNFYQRNTFSSQLRKLKEERLKKKKQELNQIKKKYGLKVHLYQ